MADGPTILDAFKKPTQTPENYLANQQSQAEGENQYWDYLWKNHPAEVWKADPIKAAAYAANQVATDASRLVTPSPESAQEIGGLIAPKPQETAIKTGVIAPEPEMGGETLPEGEYVYHATDKSRAPSIEQNGLKPNSWYAKTPQDAMKSGAVPISGNRADLRVYAVPKSEIKPTTPDVADIGAREVEKGRFIQSSERHAPSHQVTSEGKIIKEYPKTVTSASGRKMAVPSEKTTGVHDATIKQGGAIPGGRMQKAGKMEHDLVLFHDPQTGSTLALPEDKISAGNVQQHLVESRAKFSGKTKNMAAIPGAVLVK